MTEEELSAIEAELAGRGYLNKQAAQSVLHELEDVKDQLFDARFTIEELKGQLRQAHDARLSIALRLESLSRET